MRIRLTAILAMAGLLVLAGCQSTKDRFIDDYSPLNDQVLSLNGTLVRTINGAPAKTPRELATELTPLSGKLARLSREIAELDTPEDLRQESAALARTLDSAGRGTHRTATLARRADRRALADATVRLAQEANRLSRANRRLVRATGAG